MLYFKHQSNMRNDLKLKRVISKFGLEGYGLYCLILESITESLSDDSPIPDLRETCEDIAEFYNGNTSKINEMANYMVNQGLFDLSEVDGCIVCHKIYKFLDTSSTRSERIRGMIKSYKEAMATSKTVRDMSETKMIETETETEQKKKQKHKYGEYKNVLLSDSEYLKLANEWGEAERDRMIEVLSEGLELKGYKYKSHNLALRKWKSNEMTNKKPDSYNTEMNFEL